LRSLVYLAELRFNLMQEENLAPSAPPQNPIAEVAKNAAENPSRSF